MKQGAEDCSLATNDDARPVFQFSQNAHPCSGLLYRLIETAEQPQICREPWPQLPDVHATSNAHLTCLHMVMQNLRELTWNVVIKSSFKKAQVC